MQYGYLKLVHFLKKSGRLSSTGSEILTSGSHCSANFQPILDCFIPKSKLEYDELENIKNGSSNSVVFNLHQIKSLKFFCNTRYFQLQISILCYHVLGESAHMQSKYQSVIQFLCMKVHSGQYCFD